MKQYATRSERNAAKTRRHLERLRLKQQKLSERLKAKAQREIRRRRQQAHKKGSKRLTGYDKVTSVQVPVWTRTCSPTGCTTTSSSLLTIRTLRKYLSNPSPSTNNGSSRPWSPFRYDRRVVFGGPHERTNKAWYTTYGYNDYGYPIVNSRVVYDSGYYRFENPYLYTAFLENGAVLSEAQGIAQAKLLSSMKDARAQWNLANTLGEARETAGMIANAAVRMANAYGSFRKGNVRAAWYHLRGKDRIPTRHQENFRALQKRARKDNWLDEVSSAWMEFNFGWLPVLGDVDSAAKYLAEKHVRGYFPVQEISRAHRVRTTSSVNYGTGNSYLFRDTVHYMCHARYTYELHPSWARKPDTLDELGFKDPYTLAWELAPLSWLVDYFVNVGQVLESLHEFSKWGVKRGIQSHRSTTRQYRDMTRNWITPNGAPTPAASENLSTEYVNLTWCDRSTVAVLPTSVPLRVKVSNPFNLKSGQLASAMVILRYAFR